MERMGQNQKRRMFRHATATGAKFAVSDRILFFVVQQGVALTGRNTTGPPRAAAGELRCIGECYSLQTTTHASDRY